MKTIFAVLAAVLCVTGAFAEEAVLDASNLDAIRAKSGNEAIVEGMVTAIGTTKDGGITFVNIGTAKKQGFVAVAFREAYGAFTEGFDKYRNQKVRVKGVVKLYKGETPQIVLSSPEQITIVKE